MTLQVKNVGTRAGDEVVQLYLTNEGATVPVPIRQLVAFKRITLAPSQSQEVRFIVTPEQMSIIDAKGNRFVTSSRYFLAVGGTQQGFEGNSTSGPILSARFETVGRPVSLEP
jgi:beta-glucosidase